MNEEKLYELRKDVNMPGYYVRAGAKKTEAQWRAEFHLHPDQPFDWFKEWFIDLTQPIKEQQDRIKEIVDDEFYRQGLFSLSYKEAAKTIVRRVLSEFIKP